MIAPMRREQYRRSDDDERCGLIVRGLLAGKIHNQRTVLKRGLRDHGEKLDGVETEALNAAQQRLGRVARNLLRESRVDSLRGLEGEAAQTYFGVFNTLVRNNSLLFQFTGLRGKPRRSGRGWIARSPQDTFSAVKLALPAAQCIGE